MAQECGFFNAELEGSEYDRVYNAEQFAAYFASFIANGVFGNSMGELVVLENQQANMSVDVSSGQGWINGWWYRNTEELNLPIALADGVLNRKDIVVLRWGNAERDMWLQVLQGEPSGEPIAPEIVRNADYYDLKLCEIDIPAGTSRITQSQITDTRLDNNVCGLVTGVVQQIDTTELYLQFRSQFEDFKDMSEEEFNTWFDAIKGQITTDLGIRLQLEIGDLSELETEDKTDLVSAINEAASKGGTPGVFYNTDDDAEADIANIPEGSMVYTNDGEDEPINARQIAYDDGTQAGSDVETQINNIKAELKGLNHNSDSRWLRFDPSNHKGLIIKAGTSIQLPNGSYKIYSEDTSIDLSSYINNNGTDYFVYINNNGVISASTSKSSSTLKKIGRFHTLCVDVGSITMIAPASPSSGLAVGGKYLVKSYNSETDSDFYNFYNKTITAVTVQSAYDVITMQHPLSGYIAGDILPESVFCTTFHPYALVEDAMVYDKDTDRVIDVYLQSGTGFNTTSKYNETHTVSRTPYNHAEDMRMVGKRLLKDCEFTSAALGSNEKTAIIGGSDKTTVGGHVDTDNRRMISAIGCEEMCGYLFQFLDELSSTGAAGWAISDTHGSFGEEYGVPHIICAGGFWNDSTHCGSRSRLSSDSRNSIDTHRGARGSSCVVRG